MTGNCHERGLGDGFGMSMPINLSQARVRADLPYSYGLAVPTGRIYNSGACSGGQGARSSQRVLPLEATRPGLLGTPGLVYSSSQRRFIGNRIGRRNEIIEADQSEPSNCQMISSTVMTSMT